jgi:TonB family protein
MAMTTLSVEAQSEMQGFQHYKSPTFPYQLSLEAVKDGYAEVAFTVDNAGRASDAVILAASHPLFGEAVLEAIQSWTLTTAAGSSVPRREVLQVNFHRDGIVTTLSHFEAAKATFPQSTNDSRAISTLAWNQLAAPPKKIIAQTPAYPPELHARRVSGKAAVNFVIDTNGKVRVPVVVAADTPEFGTAALSAVQAWRFTPPMHDGKPVLVESTRVFTFGSQAFK